MYFDNYLSGLWTPELHSMDNDQASYFLAMFREYTAARMNKPKPTTDNK